MTQVFDFRKPETAGSNLVSDSYELVCPVFFVGFMGAGKTSVARKLAHTAGVTSIDLDTYIERREDRKVSSIFAEEGEEGFRQIESRVLRELAYGEPALISCGGGIVIRAQNRMLLRDKGFVIYLKVTPAEAASRISNLSTRPLFNDLDHAQEIIEDRLPFYEEVADAIIDTAGRGSGSISRETFALLKRRGILRAVEHSDGTA